MPKANSKTKRMHYVPQGYLRAWADDLQQVAIRRRGGADVFPTNVRNATVAGYLYGPGVNGQLREKMFGKLEDDWPDLRTALLSDGGFVTRAAREKTSVFMALQFIRTRESGAQFKFMREFAAFTPTRPVSRDDIRTFLRDHHLLFEPTDQEVEGAWTLASATLDTDDPPSLDEEMQTHFDIAIKQIAPRFEAYNWRVEHCSKPILLTSDRPVMAWRAPSVRDSYEGIGIDGAEEIRFALGPNDLLVIQRTGIQQSIVMVQQKRFRRVNAAAASQCQDQIIGTTALAFELSNIPMSAWRPTIRFNTAPGYQTMPDGTTESMGDIVHVWSPTHV
jgi:hypothetical protein